MTYVSHYASPLGGNITIASNGECLTGLWFDGQKYFGRTLPAAYKEADLPVLQAAKAYLDAYFEGRAPGCLPPLRPAGTPFQQAAWAALLRIPRGQTTTYGRIAQGLAGDGALASPCAQAVGSAVGRNPISIFIPCHRVVGADGSLTGYAGGIDKKVALLRLEGVDTGGLRLPRRGTAL